MKKSSAETSGEKWEQKQLSDGGDLPLGTHGSSNTKTLKVTCLQRIDGTAPVVLPQPGATAVGLSPMSTNHLSVSPQLSATRRARTRAPAAAPRSVPVARASRAPGAKKSFLSRSTTRLLPPPPSSPPQAPSGGGLARQGGMPPCEELRRLSHGTSQLCKSNPVPGRMLPQTPRQLTPHSVGPQPLLHETGHLSSWWRLLIGLWELT